MDISPDPLDPQTLFAGWERFSYLTLFNGMPGKPVAATVVDDDSMGWVIYQKDFSPLGNIRENREGVTKERLAWPIEFIKSARSRGSDPATRRFLYFASWRARNAELLERGSFVGWLQEESSRAREMIAWFREQGIEDIRDWLELPQRE